MSCKCPHCGKEVERVAWVKDPKTGLEWGPLSKETMTWKEAIDWAKSQGGRLPTPQELLSLLDYSTGALAKGFENMKNRYFWSSPPYADDTNNAWHVNFHNGHVNDANKDLSYSVRCVRP